MWNEIIEITKPVDDPYGFYPMDTFTKRYQHIHDKAECWKEYDIDSVIVKTVDGRAYFFDVNETWVIRIKLFDDPNELTKEEWLNGFGYWLEKAIWSSGLSKQEAAEKIGISNSLLSRYLHAKVMPSTYIVHRLAYILGRDVNDILPHDFVPVR